MKKVWVGVCVACVAAAVFGEPKPLKEAYAGKFKIGVAINDWQVAGRNQDEHAGVQARVVRMAFGAVEALAAPDVAEDIRTEDADGRVGGHVARIVLAAVDGQGAAIALELPDAVLLQRA